jgi:hypothetical protein
MKRTSESSHRLKAELRTAGRVFLSAFGVPRLRGILSTRLGSQIVLVPIVVVTFLACPLFTSAADDASPFVNAEPDAITQVPLTHPFPKIKKHGKDKVLDLDFAHLACFDFQPPDDPALQRNGERKRIPWEVVALDGQQVRIRGYMMPIRQTEEGRAIECAIVRSTLICCYGQTPAPNEWVLVKVREPGAVVLENVPLFFYGRLHVGEIYENGAFAGLYRLECDRVTMGE